MAAKILTPGGRLEINTTAKDKSKNVYLSQIYDVDEDEKTVLLGMPFKEGKLIVFSVGMHFDTYFYSNTGLYHSRAKVVERCKNNNLYCMKIELQTPLKKVQRRQYFRYKVFKPIKYLSVDDETAKQIMRKGKLPDTSDRLLLLDGNTLDISGGGIRFAGKHLEPKSRIYTEFSYPIMGEEQTLKATAIVINSEASPKRKDVFHSRVRFEYISPDDRENLIRYIFEEERKERQNERRG